MQRLNINGIKVSYDAIDLTDKILVIKAPSTTVQNIDFRSEINSIYKKFKELYNMKTILTFASDIDYETMDIDDAITYIDDAINTLISVKKELLKNESEIKEKDEIKNGEI